MVGRFYYRRPNAESSADVFDRVGAFCSELVDDLLPSQEEEFDTCLIVTHGLTMRLILMKLFQWSVETFETVWPLCVGGGQLSAERMMFSDRPRPARSLLRRTFGRRIFARGTDLREISTPTSEVPARSKVGFAASALSRLSGFGSAMSGPHMRHPAGIPLSFPPGRAQGVERRQLPPHSIGEGHRQDDIQVLPGDVFSAGVALVDA